MTDNITVTGVVASDPVFTHGTSGVSITRFRLASTQRRFDKNSNSWVDGDTNWFNVTAFRRLSDNLVTSIKKTDRVIVTGRLRVRTWENGEKSGTAVDIDADTVGHDLFWGTANFSRVTVSRSSANMQDDLVVDGSPASGDGGWADAPGAERTLTGGAAALETEPDTAPETELDAGQGSPFGNSASLVQHYPDGVTVNS